MSGKALHRGKRINNGEWVYGYLIGDDVIVGNIVEFNDEYFNTEFWCKVDPETVGQIFPFNGKDEKDLYPGDIVKTQHVRSIDGSSDPLANGAYEEYEKIGVLEYHCGYAFGPRLRWKKGHMMIPNTSTLWRMKAVKIGNIYDNPELLEEYKKEAVRPKGSEATELPSEAEAV